MKIISGFSKVKEVKNLINRGASVLFCGVLSDAFNNHRPKTSLFNFKNLNELKQAVKIAHNLNKEIYIVVNAMDYESKDKERVIQELKKIEAIKVDGLIVTDISLLILIRENNIRIPISLSSVAASYNSITIKFYEQLNVSSIILPQQLAASEIKELKRLTNLPLEVFYRNSMFNICQQIDGMCLLCNVLNRKKFIIRSKNSTDKFNVRCLKGDKSNLGSLIKGNVDSELNYIYDVYNTGVEYIKMGERGLESEVKYLAVDILSRVIKILEKRPNRATFIKNAKNIWKELYY